MTGPRMIGEKPTSPAKMGVYWWAVIVVVINLNTAFPRQGGRRLPPITVAVPKAAIACPKHRRLRSPHRDRLIFLRNDHHPLDSACLHPPSIYPALAAHLGLATGSTGSCALGVQLWWACFLAAGSGSSALGTLADRSPGRIWEYGARGVS